jgi:hypothetical protein
MIQAANIMNPIEKKRNNIHQLKDDSGCKHKESNNKKKKLLVNTSFQQ